MKEINAANEDCLPRRIHHRHFRNIEPLLTVYPRNIRYFCITRGGLLYLTKRGELNECSMCDYTFFKFDILEFERFEE